MALISIPTEIMAAIASFNSEPQQLVSHSPAALPLLPSCTHARLSIGLDRACCPDCRREFKPKTPEYQSAMLPSRSGAVVECPPEQSVSFDSASVLGDISKPVRAVVECPPEQSKKRKPACGWIEKYSKKQRWEYHRYCWQSGRNSKVSRLHIPSDSGKLLAVKSAIASGKSPLEIEQLIKSWSAKHD